MEATNHNEDRYKFASKEILVRGKCISIMMDIYKDSFLPINLSVRPADYAKGMFEVRFDYNAHDELLVQWLEEKSLKEEEWREEDERRWKEERKKSNEEISGDHDQD